MNDQLQIKPRLPPINKTATSNRLEHAEKLMKQLGGGSTRTVGK